jgi:hypothetical protein
MKARTVSLIAFYGLVALLAAIVGAAWLAVAGHPFYGAIALACCVGVGHWLISRDYAKKS